MVLQACFPVYAKIFRAQFIEFDVKNSWECENLETINWICNNSLDKKSSGPSSPNSFMIVFGKTSGGDWEDVISYSQSLNKWLV